MEAYLRFLNNIVANFQDQITIEEESKASTSKDSLQTSIIQPVYGISLETRLYEKEMHRLLGYRGLGEVRLGNKVRRIYCNRELINNNRLLTQWYCFDVIT